VIPEREMSPRATKLVCTIGPASEERIEELLAAGMDVARINFAHGSAATHAAIAASVRRFAESAAAPAGILVDLAGPKIRLGELAGGSAELEAGRPFILREPRTGDGAGDASGATASYPRLAADVRVGDAILLADGAAELRVTAVADAVETEVVRGGTVRSRSGIAIPASRLSTPALSDRDKADAVRAVELGASHIGLSFVRSGADVAELRDLLGQDRPLIVAKIETRPAVDDFDAILEVADTVMIARGDLGVELPYEEVPVLQKQLLRRALDRGVPTIVATQMLESMTGAPRPTRAEASDVANAVFDGADAIMLSAETAIGAYPVLATEAAVRIATECERHGTAYLQRGASAPAGSARALAYAAVTLAAAHPDVAAIACYTRSGRTAAVLSSLRPPVPIIASSPDASVVAQLALVHGVVPRHSVPLDEADPLRALQYLMSKAGLLPEGAGVVLVSSRAGRGSTPNVLGLYRVERSTTR
jgi:pyruvate kinase